MNESRELAQFAAQATFRDLPTSVVARAKDLIVDSFGVQLVASTKPWSKIIYRYVMALGGRPECTIVNYGDRAPAPQAAFVNASFAHGIEMDDTLRHALLHIGCVVIPAALAVGEQRRSDGREFLLAVAIGCEVSARVALSMSYASPAAQAVHRTSFAGTFGAAAAASKLLRLDHEVTLNALSIAGSHSCGVKEYLLTGGSVKRMHAGLAAEGGVRSALLARDGLTGPPTILEGDWGVSRVGSMGHPKPVEITDSLGREWRWMEAAYKRYAQDYALHSMTDALSLILAEHPVEADDVEEIAVRCAETTHLLVGTRDPQEVTEAHFSANFSLALRLVKGGAGFREYTEENLWDPQVRRLAQRIRLERDEEMDRLYPDKQSAHVTVLLKNGTKYEARVDSAKGTAENPLSSEELQDKFRNLSTVVLPANRVEEIIGVVNKLEALPDVSELAGMLVK